MYCLHQEWVFNFIRMSLMRLLPVLATPSLHVRVGLKLSFLNKALSLGWLRLDPSYAAISLGF